MVNAELSVWNIKEPHKVNSTSACHQDCIDNPDCDYFVHRKESGYCLLKGLKAYKKTGRVRIKLLKCYFTNDTISSYSRKG